MKNATTNYENTFYFDGAALSGVLSVDGSYNLVYEPINVIGKGFTKSVMASVPSAQLSFSRYMTNDDPVFNLTGDGSQFLAKKVDAATTEQVVTMQESIEMLQEVNENLTIEMYEIKSNIEFINSTATPFELGPIVSDTANRR